MTQTMKIKRFEFNMFPVNCYVVWDDTKEAAIIDPGCYYHEEKQKLKQFILNNELTVKHLLNTHLHLDHIFGNAFLQQELGLQAQAHHADLYWLEEAPKQSRMYGFPLPEPPAPITRFIEDGDFISFGNTTLRAIHVPGHSPGSLVFHHAESPCLFAGDVLFRGSIGRADLMGGNFDQLIEGITRRLLTLPNETIVYSGHGDPTTIGAEKVENPFLRQ